MQPDHDEITTPPCAVHNSRAPSPIAVGYRSAEVGPREGEQSCSPSRGAISPRPPLKRKTPLERSGRLRRRSAKTAKVYREERVPFVRRVLDERPDCEACHLIRLRAPLFRCGGRSVDVHEVKTRGRGGDFLDEENVLAVCRLGHRWIGNNQQAALELGLLLHSWEPVPLAAERRAAVLEGDP